MTLSKVAIKKLTSSDLTLFAEHYHRPEQKSKQKAINLNADIFVQIFYPGLRDRFSEIHFALNIVGPGGASSYALSRKAVRTEGAKNWRLNGEIINDPPGEERRFARLEEGDLAFIAFEGNEIPQGVTLVLVSRSQDPLLHHLAASRFELSGRYTMQVVESDFLMESIAKSSAAYQGQHPFENFLIPDSIEEAVSGPVSMQEQVARSGGKGIRISQESLQRQIEEAARTGNLGEECFERWLIQRGLTDADYEWVSKEFARSAFDFVLTDATIEDGFSRFWVDVKTTISSFETAFHMSLSEIRWAARHEEYRICRVVLLPEHSAEIFWLSGVHELSKRIESLLLSALPEGVRCDSFEISPLLLKLLHRDVLHG